MKIIIIPDSFKGTMSSERVCDIMAEAIYRRFPYCETVKVPVADGGEGSVQCLLSATGGRLVRAAGTGPFFEEMEGFYGILPSGDAVIEMACCAGLPLAEGRLNPETATTFGVGQLMRDAAGNGVKKLIIALGGSCTNDYGCGAAAALGVKFLDRDGNSFVPTGGTLANVAKIDISGIDPLIKQCEIECICDIDNPTCGPEGAACVYSPQKGADAEMVKRLDAGLKHICEVARNDLGVNTAELPGGGAAGGMAAGLAAMLGAKLRPGIEVVLDTVGFDKMLEGADLVFTGEGRIDSQSLRGKVVVGVARRAFAKSVPVVAIVGDAEPDIEAVYDIGVSAVFSINRIAAPFEKIKSKSEEFLRLTTDNILRLYGLNR